MKQLLLILILSISSNLLLPAQSTDPELADKLKSVMVLFDKNQQALKDEITQLSASNTALTSANLKLYQDLRSAQQVIQDLEAENTMLRSKISAAVVNELQARPLETALQTQPSARPGAVAAASARQPSGGQVPLNSQNDLININTASKDELITLPLIDEAMAEQIISNRPYNTIEDLIINTGFGPMKLRRVTPYVIAE